MQCYHWQPLLRSRCLRPRSVKPPAHTNLHCAAKGGKSMRAMHGPAVAGIIASDLYGVAPDPAAPLAEPARELCRQ